jgi:hypothetical protein
VVQTLCRHILTGPPPPRWASHEGKRPRLRFLGLQGQSFHTPLPLRVTGVWNQSDGGGAEEMMVAQRGGGSDEAGVLFGRVRRSVDQGEREFQMQTMMGKKEEAGVGFLRWRREGESGGDPGERDVDCSVLQSVVKRQMIEIDDAPSERMCAVG